MFPPHECGPLFYFFAALLRRLFGVVPLFCYSECALVGDCLFGVACCFIVFLWTLFITLTGWVLLFLFYYCCYFLKENSCFTGLLAVCTCFVTKDYNSVSFKMLFFNVFITLFMVRKSESNFLGVSLQQPLFLFIST